MGPFHIVSEFSVASGVRRIEATTGLATLNDIHEMEDRIAEAANVIKAKPAELLPRVKAQLEENRDLHREVEHLKAQAFAGDADQILFSARNVGGLKVLTATKNGVSADDLRKLGDLLREKSQDTVAVLSAVNDEKITLLAVCGKNAVQKGIKAGELVKKVSGICGGSGGGKPDSAMGGGKDLTKLDDALAVVDDFVAEKLGL